MFWEDIFWPQSPHGHMHSLDRIVWFRQTWWRNHQSLMQFLVFAPRVCLVHMYSGWSFFWQWVKPESVPAFRHCRLSPRTHPQTHRRRFGTAVQNQAHAFKIAAKEAGKEQFCLTRKTKGYLEDQTNSCTKYYSIKCRNIRYSVGAYHGEAGQ